MIKILVLSINRVTTYDGVTSESDVVSMRLSNGTISVWK